MKRRALLIGVEVYRHDAFLSLNHAVEDARRFREFLRLLDGTAAAFEQIELMKNPEDGEVFERVEEFCRGLKREDLLLVYFAGHGVQQRSRSQQLLLCKEARPEVIASDSTNGAVALPALDQMTSGAFDRVFIFDACRNDFFRPKFQSRGEEAGRVMSGAACFREVGARGFSQVVPGSTVTIWSCNDGERAAEVDEIEGGLFTHELLCKLGEALRAGTGVRLNEQFISEVRQAMAARMGIMVDQTPTISCQNGSIELFPPVGILEDATPFPPMQRDAMRVEVPLTGEVSPPPASEFQRERPSGRRVLAVYGALVAALLLAAALEWHGVAILRRVLPMIGLSTPE